MNDKAPKTASEKPFFGLYYCHIHLFAKVLGRKMYELATDTGINYMYFYRKSRLKKPVTLDIVAKLKKTYTEERYEQIIHEMQCELEEKRIYDKFYNNPQKRLELQKAIPFERLTWKECEFIIDLCGITKKTLSDLFLKPATQISLYMNWNQTDRLSILQQEKLREFIGEEQWQHALLHLKNRLAA